MGEAASRPGSRCHGARHPADDRTRSRRGQQGLRRRSDAQVRFLGGDRGHQRETDNPLLHGEISTLNQFYARTERPPTRDLVFLSTHEPCPLCLSAITWAGSTTSTTSSPTRIPRRVRHPHDLKILKEVFGVDDGAYRRSNAFWTCLLDSRLVESRTRAATHPAGEQDHGSVTSMRGCPSSIRIKGRQRHSVQLTSSSERPRRLGRRGAQVAHQIAPLADCHIAQPQPRRHRPQLRRQRRRHPRRLLTRFDECADDVQRTLARSAFRSTRPTSWPSSRNGQT